MDKTASNRSWSRRLLACSLSATMAIGFVPASALAADAEAPAAPAAAAERVEGAQAASGEAAASMVAEAQAAATLLADGTVACENGWTLAYGAVDGGVAITGVSVSGSGALSIPAAIDGQPVVAIANSAFAGCSALRAVTIPDSVTSLGLYAFMNSGVTSVNIPASVQRIPYRCFALCSSLSSIDFQGESMRYLSQQSFYSCSSLREIEVPLLTDTPQASETAEDGLNGGSVSYGASIGASCFENCSSLSRIVFRGPVVEHPTRYFVNTSCLAGCPQGLEIVCLCATVDLPSGTSSASILSATGLYYTLDFYTSESDAEGNRNRVASVTMLAETREKNSDGRLESRFNIRLFDLLNGTTNYSSYLYEGSADRSIPAAPAGKVWGVIPCDDDVNDFETDSSLNPYAYMTGSYKVVAVDPGDVAYGWVSSPSIDEFDAENGGTGGSSEDDHASLYMEADGSIPELSQIAAYATDGSRIDSGSYRLVFEQAHFTYEMTSSGRQNVVTSWEPIAYSSITSSGTYRVYATGTGSHAGSRTDYVYFDIVAPEPAMESYDGSNVSAYLGTLEYDAAVNLGASPAYNVLVPASDWRNQLLGAGFAGAGDGLLLTDCGSSYSNNMMQAAMQSGSDSYIIIGSNEAVPQSVNVRDERYLADFVAERTGTYGTRYGADASTAQELAASAIGRFRPTSWNAEWGSVAVVASSTDELVTEAAAQYVYGNAARVFFLRDDGTIDDADITSLAASDISQIVLVGDEDHVSASVASAIATRTGKTPTRILEGDTAADASLDLAQQLVDAGTRSYSTVVIADATDSANVSNAAVLAESADGVMLTCRTSADAKAIEAFFESMIATSGWDMVSNLAVVGSFDYLDDAGEFFSGAWNVEYSDLNVMGSVDIEAGDTFEIDGYIYRVEGVGIAQLVEVTGGANSANAPASVTYAGETYTVDGSVAPDPSVSFTDVPDDYWGRSYIEQAAEAGYMAGDRDAAGNLTGTFRPEDYILRSETAQVFYNMLGDTLSGSATTTFPDVASGDWFYPAVMWAAQTGVVTGDINTGLFNPGQNVTREQVALMMQRAAARAGIGGTTLADISRYEDADEVSGYAREAMEWAVGQRIFGQNVTELNPTDPITRAELATTAVRFAAL